MAGDPPAPTELEHADELEYTLYDEETDLVNRNLIPTWIHVSPIGHSASDNYFVAVGGGDDLPDLAIGRFTVVEPEGVAHIVDKTIRYMSSPEIGPWRRKMVFLTNTLKKFHRQSRWAAGFTNAAGFVPREIYPSIEEPDNEQYTRQLSESLNEGQLFVHYLGHGGRYIWETGQRDLAENRDLFTLDHLDALEPTRRLPVVLSLTCFTAPFDHPDADSLGEKLLRLPDRGAIAVFAASQANGPSGNWGQILLDELTRPGTTIGEAVLRAKRHIRDTEFNSTYNLLGDPAVPVALPATGIELSVEGVEGGPFIVRGTVDVSSFSGKLLVELVNRDLESVRSTSTPLDGFEFDLDVELSAEERDAVRVVRAYAWDAARGIDAAGAVELGGSLSQPRPPRTFRKLTGQQGEADLTAPAGAEEILASAAAWSSFDETADDFVDDCLDAHPGTLIDSANRTFGPRGGAFSFYGRGFLEFDGESRLDLGTGDFTLHGWIRTRQSS